MSEKYIIFHKNVYGDYGRTVYASLEHACAYVSMCDWCCAVYQEVDISQAVEEYTRRTVDAEREERRELYEKLKREFE